MAKTMKQVITHHCLDMLDNKDSSIDQRLECIQTLMTLLGHGKYSFRDAVIKGKRAKPANANEAAKPIDIKQLIAELPQ